LAKGIKLKSNSSNVNRNIYLKCVLDYFIWICETISVFIKTCVSVLIYYFLRITGLNDFEE